MPAALDDDSPTLEERRLVTEELLLELCPARGSAFPPSPRDAAAAAPERGGGAFLSVAGARGESRLALRSSPLVLEEAVLLSAPPRGEGRRWGWAELWEPEEPLFFLGCAESTRSVSWVWEELFLEGVAVLRLLPAPSPLVLGWAAAPPLA